MFHFKELIFLLLFGHLGLTIGIVYLLAKIKGVRFSQRMLAVTAVGALLPDIIDKPIGQIFFYDYFSNNRIFAHTLIFLALLGIITIFLYNKGYKWAPILTVASAVHILLDGMWNDYRTLLWPAYGISFERMDLSNWASDNINSMLNNPYTYVPEILGLAILIVAITKLSLPNAIKINKASISDSESRSHKVSLVVPTMNEEKNVPHVFSSIPNIVDEVVVVDSSSDNTVDAIMKIRPDARIFVEKPMGKGNALKKGLEYATGDIIIAIDADGSMDLKEIPLFVKPLMNGFDVVKGSRVLGGSDDLTLFRSFGNFCLTALVNILYDSDYSDLTYGYQGFKKTSLDMLKCVSEGFDIEVEQLIKAKKLNLKVCEVPCIERKRMYGNSNLKAFGDGKKILMRILREKVAR